MSGPCTPYPLGDNSSPPPWRVCQTQSLDFSRPNGREIFKNLKQNQTHIFLIQSKLIKCEILIKILLDFRTQRVR